MIFIFNDNINAVSKEIVKIDLPNGYCLFKLGKLLNDKNISINQFMRDTDTDFKTIKKHANGLAQQIDTLLINKGASVALVSKYLGHSDIATTLNIYSHMFKSELQDIAEELKDL